jgi:hypothetical protein
MFLGTIHNILDKLDVGSIPQIRARVTGNQLELSVSPDPGKERVSYRNAVIQVGQILHKVEQHSKITGVYTHVNTFPSLEESRLIATVRFTNEPKPKRHQEDKTDLTNITPLSDKLKSIAKTYGLTINTSDCSNLKALTAENNTLEKIVDTCEQCFTITSAYDNPFVWLKTGLYVEGARHILEQNAAELCTSYHYNLSFEVIEAFRRANQQNAHLQAVLVVCTPKVAI